MNNDNEIKKVVKEKYGQIALNVLDKDSTCGCCCSTNEPIAFSHMNEGYENIEGYVPEADLSLGCGIPVEFANIKQGDTVLDLGSGAGNDVFVARHLVGEKGKVIGIDMTEEMIEKANQNNKKLGFKNVEFRLGEIEALPIENNSIDVVISNCVLNLVPNKEKAFSEIFRVLKPDASFCISDIVLRGELPPGLKESAIMYAGCVAGALQDEEYLNIIKNAGFKDIEIKKEKVIQIPNEILAKYLKPEEVKNINRLPFSIISITVVGRK